MDNAGRILTVACLIVSVPTWAVERYQLNIGAQPLSTALQEFARQSGLQVVYYGRVTDGLQAARVAGKLTADAALKKLLAGTELEYEVLDEHTVTIDSVKRKDVEQRSEKTTSTAESPQDTFRLAQADPIEGGSPGGWRTQPKKADGAPAEAESIDLEEVVVTGTHIRGNVEIAAPVIGATRTQIEQEGYFNLADYFETLPQNFATVSAESAVGRTTSTVAQNNSEERVASVDLRGLGAESTLTLLNGRRLAGALNGRVVDISSIPLSALERVDVVTGGASAIYGADAVGGVVNLVTRRPESGAESQFTASRGRDGGGRLQVSQSAGWRGDQGGLLAAYEFQYDEPLDLTDGALFRTPSASGVSYNSLFLQPLERRHSIFLTGDYGLGERVKAYGNSLLSSKDISSNQHYKYDGASGDTSDDYKTDSEQFAATAGIVAELTANWSLDVALSTSRYQRETDTESHYVFPGLPASFERQGVASSEVELWSGSAIVQGVPFYLGGHEVRVATGAEFRKERLDTNSAYTGFFPTTIRYQDSRSIRSVFGELRLPIGEGRGGPGALLELSAAGRYDDYSDFGDSFNPLVGAIIRPVKGFTVRGNYSRAFRAPALIDTTPEYSAYLDRLPDPASATGQTTVFSAVGGDPGLKPERAKAWTLSIDVQPAALTGMFASVSYFDVHYRDRIATPAPYPDDLTVLQHLDIYSPVLNLAPQEADFTRLLSGAATFVDNLGTTFNADEPASALTLFPDAVIFDNRTTNVSLERVRGVDGLLSYSAPAGAGELKVALNGSYTLAHDSSITATSPTVSRLNDLGKPVDFRARIFIGWSTQTWTVSLSGNYVDGYENTSSAPPASVDSWLTADLGVGLRTAALVDGGLWDDLQLSLSVQNLFDSDPPFADDFSRLLYDPTNANALGRIVVMRIGKRW